MFKVANVRPKSVPQVPVAKPKKAAATATDSAAAAAAAEPVSPVDRSALRRSASGTGMSSAESAQQRRALSFGRLTAVDDEHKLRRQLSATQRRLTAVMVSKSSGCIAGGSSSGLGLAPGSSSSNAAPWQLHVAASPSRADVERAWLTPSPFASSAAGAEDLASSEARG